MSEIWKQASAWWVDVLAWIKNAPALSIGVFGMVRHRNGDDSEASGFFKSDAGQRLVSAVAVSTMSALISAAGASYVTVVRLSEKLDRVVSAVDKLDRIHAEDMRRIASELKEDAATVADIRASLARIEGMNGYHGPAIDRRVK